MQRPCWAGGECGVRERWGLWDTVIRPQPGGDSGPELRPGQTWSEASMMSALQAMLHVDAACWASFRINFGSRCFAGGRAVWAPWASAGEGGREQRSAFR